MKVRVLLFAAVAVVSAGGTAFLVQGWLNKQRAEFARSAKAPPVQGPVTTAILVARKALPAGTFVKPEDVRWQPWPEGSIDPSYVKQDQRDPASFTGAVVRRGIVAGEPITDARVVKPGDRGFLAVVLSPGSRAVSVPVTVSSAISGLVFPGDRVDLILSHRSAEAGEHSKGESILASETVLENVRVIAMDQSTDDQKGKAEVASVPKTATLEVTPRQAEMVMVAAELGKLAFSLRSLTQPEDTDIGGDVAAADPDAAIRGQTITHDIEVSRLISEARKAPVVHLLRGSKSEVVR
jgi:pilus assembly protein CpaB